MDVELPPGAALGVEQKERDGGNNGPAGQGGLLGLGLDSGGGGGGAENAAAAARALQRSDRELARLYVEMFRPIKEAVTVVFSTSEDARAAAGKWSEDTRILSFTESGGGGSGGMALKGKKGGGKKKMQSAAKLKGKGGGGFAAKLAAATASTSATAASGGSGPEETSGSGGGSGSGGLQAGEVPEGTEVLIVVAPKGRDLDAVEAVCGKVGLGCCVILLNARLDAARFTSDAQRAFFIGSGEEEEEKEGRGGGGGRGGAFEAVFQLKPPPPAVFAEASAELDGDAVRGGAVPVLSRAYPGDWLLSLKPLVSLPGTGGAKTLATFKERPSRAELVSALASSEALRGEGLEGKVSSLLGKITNIMG